MVERFLYIKKSGDEESVHNYDYSDEMLYSEISKLYESIPTSTSATVHTRLEVLRLMLYDLMLLVKYGGVTDNRFVIGLLYRLTIILNNR